MNRYVSTELYQIIVETSEGRQVVDPGGTLETKDELSIEGLSQIVDVGKIKVPKPTAKTKKTAPPADGPQINVVSELQKIFQARFTPGK